MTDPFMIFKHLNSQREIDINKIIHLLRGGDYDSLSEACYAIHLDPHTLTQKEINYIKRNVD